MTEVTGRDGYILHRAVSEARRHEDAQGFPPDVNVVRVLQGQSFPHLRPTLARALYFAIKCQESLPDDEREWSNMQDMIALLLAIFPREAKRLVKADKAAGREPAVLIDEKAPR